MGKRIELATVFRRTKPTPDKAKAVKPTRAIPKPPTEDAAAILAHKRKVKAEQMRRYRAAARLRKAKKGLQK